MNRPSLDEHFLALARESAKRSSCRDLQVGAVVADSRGIIVASGWNGLARGLPNCCDNPCLAWKTVGSVRCASVHAEANALVAAGRLAVGGTLAVTVSPCVRCMSLAVNAGIIRVIWSTQWKRYFEPEGETGLSPYDVWRLAGLHGGTILSP